MEEHDGDDKYLFDINIKLVSESKDLDILISEWEQYKPLFDTIQEIKGRCICIIKLMEILLWLAILVKKN